MELRCSKCLESSRGEAEDLLACKSCFAVFCSTCALANGLSGLKLSFADRAGIVACRNTKCPKSTCRCGQACKCGEDTVADDKCCARSAFVRKGKHRDSSDSAVKELTPESLLATQAYCGSCKHRVCMCRLPDLSLLARKLCKSIVDGEDIDALCCIVCGCDAFNNRVCPHCSALYCSLCLEQWAEANGSSAVSCAYCRDVQDISKFEHDRFAAKLLRVRSSSTDSRATHSDLELSLPDKKALESTSQDNYVRRICVHFWLKLVLCCTLLLLIVSCLKSFTRSVPQKTGGQSLLCVPEALPKEKDLTTHASMLQSHGDLQAWVHREISCSLSHCSGPATLKWIDLSSPLPWIWAPCNWSDSGFKPRQRLERVSASLYSLAQQNNLTSKLIFELFEALNALEVRLVVERMEILDAYLVAAQLQDAAKCLNLLYHVMEQASDYCLPYVLTSSIHKSAGQLTTALDVANKCLKHCVGHLQCTLARLQLLSKLGRLQTVEDEFEQFRAKFPSVFETVFADS